MGRKTGRESRGGGVREGETDGERGREKRGERETEREQGERQREGERERADRERWGGGEGAKIHNSRVQGKQWLWYAKLEVEWSNYLKSTLQI